MHEWSGGSALERSLGLQGGGEGVSNYNSYRLQTKERRQTSGKDVEFGYEQLYNNTANPMNVRGGNPSPTHNHPLLTPYRLYSEGTRCRTRKTRAVTVIHRPAPLKEN